LPDNTVQQLWLCRQVNEAEGTPIDPTRWFRKDDPLITVLKLNVPVSDRPLHLGVYRDGAPRNAPPLWNHQIPAGEGGRLMWLKLDLAKHESIRGNCVLRISVPTSANRGSDKSPAEQQVLASQSFRVD
jgi:hypothetical protein